MACSPAPTNPVTPGVLRMTYQAVVVEFAANQQVAGENLLLNHDLFAIANLVDILKRNRSLVNLALHIHGASACLKILADLVLVTRLRVQHIPFARTVIGTDGFGDLIEKLVGVEHFGARFGRLILGLDGFSMLSSSGRILPRCVDLRIGDINGSYLGVCH
jgi:hypothetical protein